MYVAIRWVEGSGEEVLHTTPDLGVALGAADSFRPELGLCEWEQVNEDRWMLFMRVPESGCWQGTGLSVVKR